MAGDFSRRTHDPHKHYISVEMQQGRVQVDADPNEQAAITRQRIEREARDVVGPNGAPKKDGGFAIGITPGGGDLTLSPGRLYADGVLCEVDGEWWDVTATANQATVTIPALLLDGRPVTTDQWLEVQVGAAAPQLLRVAAVNVSATSRTLTFASNITSGGAARLRRVTTFLTQPDVVQPAVPAAGTYVAYLDVFDLEISALDDPNIREVALGGPDTARRTKVVWQLRLLPVAANDCNDAAQALAAAKPPSTGMLVARTEPLSGDVDPCLLPPSSGYRGLENQLYRVEIHRGGELPAGSSAQPPTFKWSRDNASVESSMSLDGTTITVNDLGKDDVLRFREHQWVEIVDDEALLEGRANALSRIDTIQPSTRAITLRDGVHASASRRNMKLRRWDQTRSATTDGIVITTGEVELEAGVKVRFLPGRYTAGDYWLIPARTAVQDVLWPGVSGAQRDPRPPAGVRHRYVPLALVERTATAFSVTRDCRKKFPSLTEICADDVCFDNSVCTFPSNVKNVQQALDELCRRNDLRLHNKYLHGWGVVCGLQVVCRSGMSVRVKEGYAIDCEGYDLFVRDDQNLDLTRLPGAEHLQTGRACLTLERGADGRPRFALRAHAEQELADRLKGTLLSDFYNGCLKELFDYVKSALDPRDQPGEEDVVHERQMRLTALTNILIELGNARDGRHVFVSEREHKLLEELWTGLRDKFARSRTSCLLPDPSARFPRYDLAPRDIWTMFTKGYQTRLRYNLRQRLLYAFGRDHKIHVVDASHGSYMFQLAVEPEDAVVQDVAVSLDGRELYIAATSGGDTHFLVTSALVKGDLEKRASFPGIRVIALASSRHLRAVYGITEEHGLVEIDPDTGRMDIHFDIRNELRLMPRRHFEILESQQGWTAFVAVDSGSAQPGIDTYNGLLRIQPSGDAVFHELKRFDTSGSDGIAVKFERQPNPDRPHVVYAVLDPAPGRRSKRLAIIRGFNEPATEVDLEEENSRISIAAMEGSMVAIAYEDRHHLRWVTEGNLEETILPLQVCPAAVVFDRNTDQVFALNRTSNTIISLPIRGFLQQPYDLAALAAYHERVLRAFLDLAGELFQSIKDCFCEHLLVDCPTCTGREVIQLACVEVDQQSQTPRIRQICFTGRRYVHTFRSVEYWLSLVPVLPMLRWAVEKFCCEDITRWFEKIDPDENATPWFECEATEGLARLFQTVPQIIDELREKLGSTRRTIGLVAVDYRARRVATEETRLAPRDLTGTPTAAARERLEEERIAVLAVESFDPKRGAREAASGITTFKKDEPVVIVDRKGKVAYFKRARGDEQLWRKEIDRLRTEIGPATSKAEIGELREQLAATRKIVEERDAAVQEALALRSVVAKLETELTQVRQLNAATTERLRDLDALSKQVSTLERLVKRPQ